MLYPTILLFESPKLVRQSLYDLRTNRTSFPGLWAGLVPKNTPLSSRHQRRNRTESQAPKIELWDERDSCGKKLNPGIRKSLDFGFSVIPAFWNPQISAKVKSWHSEITRFLLIKVVSRYPRNRKFLLKWYLGILESLNFCEIKSRYAGNPKFQLKWNLIF